MYYGLYQKYGYTFDCIMSKQYYYYREYDRTMGSSPGELSEQLVMQEKQRKGCRKNCDVGEATEGLENEL